MTGRPPDTDPGQRDAPEAADPVMLAVLSNKGRRLGPLSVEHQMMVSSSSPLAFSQSSTIPTSWSCCSMPEPWMSASDVYFSAA